MMHYLSRLTLNRAAGMAALAPLLQHDQPGPAMAASHRMIWTLFGDSPDRRRDFLWRADGAGRFYILSARPPRGNDLFQPPEVKDFAPVLKPGDRLAFRLRANATKTRKTGRRTASGKEHKAHDDIVMQRLLPLKTGRAEKRMALAAEAARDWMDAQGRGAGFAVTDLAVEDYSAIALPGHRGARKKQPQFGVLDLTGVLTVTDPGPFLARLTTGFGRAKSYGCGLMLIRRT